MSQKELEELKEKILQLDLPLKEGHSLVFGKGNPDARIMLIGEAPGEKEDIEGVPFVGSAGKLLDKLLASAGLSLNDVYIANILKYRPPDNRNPTYDEIIAHTPYLIAQIRIIKPNLIVTMGNFATRFVIAGFDTNRMKDVTGITSLHGKVKTVSLDGDAFPVMPTYHPAAALYNPKLRTELEADFGHLKSIMSEIV